MKRKTVVYTFVVKDEDEANALHNDLHGYLNRYDCVFETMHDSTVDELIACREITISNNERFT